ncbi:MAG: 5'-methylthioadenosine/S-adenosylhomocysteine nucleosidase [Pseudomonadota bacterium]
MRALAFAATLVAGALCAHTAAADDTPRTAVISAYEPEWTTLKTMVEGREEVVDGGVTYVTGTIEGRPVVLFLSGIGMVNAAMNTQRALDRFAVTDIVFSGIAGGVDPDLNVGDLVIADQWGQYLYMVLARETADGFEVPPFFESPLPNFGMMFPHPTEVRSARAPDPEERFWFPVDPELLAIARTAAADVSLLACAGDTCLTEPPKVVVGGNGVSGSAFVDNAKFRRYTSDVFEAKVLDMETASVAHVAYANEVPYIAFRSLADLAGGGEGANELSIFFGLAADNAAAMVRAYLAARS